MSGTQIVILVAVLLGLLAWLCSRNPMDQHDRQEKKFWRRISRWRKQRGDNENRPRF